MRGGVWHCLGKLTAFPAPSFRWRDGSLHDDVRDCAGDSCLVGAAFPRPPKQITRWHCEHRTKSQKILDFHSPTRGMTNPILQDAARIEIVPSEKRETPALKEVLSLARREISLAPSRLARMQSLRTSELGIRMALGAQRDQLLQLMLMDGLRPALFGLGLGLVVSFAATRIFQSMLFGTKPLDPVVLSGVIATLLAVAVLACLAPACVLPG
jgi:hypothetical protein